MTNKTEQYLFCDGVFVFSGRANPVMAEVIKVGIETTTENGTDRFCLHKLKSGGCELLHRAQGNRGGTYEGTKVNLACGDGLTPSNLRLCDDEKMARCKIPNVASWPTL
jgi:hypothetical protein